MPRKQGSVTTKDSSQRRGRGYTPGCLATRDVCPHRRERLPYLSFILSSTDTLGTSPVVVKRGAGPCWHGACTPAWETGKMPAWVGRDVSVCSSQNGSGVSLPVAEEHSGALGGGKGGPRRVAGRHRLRAPGWKVGGLLFTRSTSLKACWPPALAYHAPQVIDMEVFGVSSQCPARRPLYFLCFISTSPLS